MTHHHRIPGGDLGRIAIDRQNRAAGIDAADKGVARTIREYCGLTEMQSDPALSGVSVVSAAGSGACVDPASVAATGATIVSIAGFIQDATDPDNSASANFKDSA